MQIFHSHICILWTTVPLLPSSSSFRTVTYTIYIFFLAISIGVLFVVVVLNLLLASSIKSLPQKWCPRQKSKSRNRTQTQNRSPKNKGVQRRNVRPNLRLRGVPSSSAGWRIGHGCRRQNSDTEYRIQIQQQIRIPLTTPRCVVCYQIVCKSVSFKKQSKKKQQQKKIK